MHFRFTDHAARDLGLDPRITERVFSGPSLADGEILGGFDLRTLRIAKTALGTMRLDTLDVDERKIVYCALVVHGADGSILGNGMSRILDLALVHFTPAEHIVTGLDRDGDCDDCGNPVDAEIHTGVADGVGVPPTPDQSPTSEMQTP